MLLRLVLGVVFVIGMAPAATIQDVASSSTPEISLALPPGIASETAQINYFMVGPFGGYGDFVTAEKGQAVYDITASVRGTPATSVKIIAYLPGCEIETLEIPVHDGTVPQKLVCKPLQQIVLHGQISPTSILQPSSEIEVTYAADWDHKFFGITDGPVTTIRVATAFPDQNGQFNVAVPDFHAQANLGNGELQFTLKQTKTGNIIAFLQPADRPVGSRGLKVQASYASLVQFSALRLR